MGVGTCQSMIKPKADGKHILELHLLLFDTWNALALTSTVFLGAHQEATSIVSNKCNSTCYGK